MEFNGRPVTADQLATLAQVNYGHFTTVRLDDGGVRGLGLHLERLVRDCDTVFGARLDPDRVRGLARRVAARSGSPAMLRITVFDPEIQLGRTGGEAHPGILVTVRPAGPAIPSPIRLRSVSYQRDLPQVKHTGLLGPLHRRRAAQRAGFDDALFVDAAGRICEGPTWNIGFVVGGEVHWPVAECLPGITAHLLDGVLDRAGVPVRRAPLTLDGFDGPYGAFVTSTGVGIGPVAAIDGRELVSDRSLLDRLRAGYLAIPAEPW